MHGVRALGELLDDLRAERGLVVRTTTGNEALVGDHLLVDDVATGVADVGPEARVPR